MNSVDNSTIVSLHRPFHGPLWVARWVCEFVRFYKKDSNGGRINSADFFLFYIFRLKKLYDKHDEIYEYVSRQTIEDVCGYFAQLKTISQKKNALDVILHSKRDPGTESHVYSVYKASTYAVNLAEDKLGFIKKGGLTDAGKQLHLQRTPSIDIKNSDRRVYLQQILAKDFYFFVPFCMLQKYKKEGIDPDNAIFDFSERYHKVQRFDYTHCSHDNYTKVRMQWISQLDILTDNHRLRTWVKEEITNIYAKQFEDLQAEIKEFVKDQKKNIESIDKLEVFYDAYSSLIGTSDGSGYVDLYDIMSRMPHMGYNKFNNLLQTYYEQRNRKENIFLINIIATLDLRKRFIVRGKPVMKIKILR